MIKCTKLIKVEEEALVLNIICHTVQCTELYWTIHRVLYITHYTTSWLLLYKLEGMACYAGLLLAPAEGFGLRPRLFLGKKRDYYAVLAHFWQFFVSSSNLGNFN